MASVGRRPQSAYAGGTRSYMGAQVLSHKASSPSFSFGSSPSRVQVTIERSASKDLLMPSVASSKEKTPGPIYNPLPARRYLGDGPRHVFGTEEQRPPLARVSKSTGKSSTPGPGAYAVPSSMGHQTLGLRASSSAYSFGLSRQRVSLSRAKSAGPGPIYSVAKGATMRGVVRPAAYTFGNELRHRRAAATSTPGPGNYLIGSSLGLQVASTNRSGPIAGFGQPPLASHIGRPMQLEGSHSPGPRYSVGTNSCGRQLLSSARSQPSGAFARANRFVDPKDAANTPGPGEYVV